jgi:hypothetical protein
MRFELREASAWLREQLGRACLWNWEITRLPRQGDNPYDILYVGRKKRRHFAQILLAIKSAVDVAPLWTKRSSRTVLCSEMPVPGALCVPIVLRNILALDRPIEEIMARYEKKLRQTARKFREGYRLQQALSDAEIERADREMLQPFARARHGNSAMQIPSGKVRSLAQKYGRLDLVLSGDELVGCTIGYETIRAGKRYWCFERFGCPETVFSDQKRLSETTSIIYMLVIAWAIDNGFDYCDFTDDFARPDNELLQYKRRRGTALDTIGLQGSGCFHVRLPGMGAAQFLWNAPLFAVERHHLTLHLGLPDERSDEEAANRYRLMGFDGLFRIYLHCARLPDEQLVETLRSLYAHQKSPPNVEIIPCT